MDFKTFENYVYFEIFYINLDIIKKNLIINIFEEKIKKNLENILKIFLQKESQKQAGIAHAILFAPN
jgi:hypothetical protein